jgi:hypothetical protein
MLTGLARGRGGDFLHGIVGHLHRNIGAIDAVGRRGTHRNLRDPVADDFRPAIPHRQGLSRPPAGSETRCGADGYPDSEHGFDAGPLGVNTVTVSTNAQSARNCRIKEGEGGVLMNDDTKEPFTYKDARIALNPHVGGNPATAKQAQKAVSEFLQALLKLG